MSDCGSLAHLMWATGERDTPWPDVECWEAEACAHHRTAADDDEREARWERAIADSLIRADRPVGTDALEPPTHEACPDCKAEIGEPCTWACSSRWT